MSWIGQLPPQELLTYDRQGNQYRFWVRYNDHNFPEPSDFTVYVSQESDWPPPNHAWYEVSIKQQADGQFQTVNMNNGKHPHLSKKGIGVALLPAVCRLL